MQFNQPQVLYTLFLLIIPVIVHLFQLRKFKREKFTNVKFLKRLSRQTRKSSRLKKWLILATRLLLLTSIIVAFSRPYFPEQNQHSDNAAFETLIYLDNSYSMQASGKNGKLLNHSIQQLLEHLPDDRDITLITNNEEFAQVTRRNLQGIDFSVQKTDFNAIFLKAAGKSGSGVATKNRILFISDFAESLELPQDLRASGTRVYVLPVVAQNTPNISLDSLYNTPSIGVQKVAVQLSYTGNKPGIVPVSLYDSDRLLGKSSMEFSSGPTEEIEFVVQNEIIQNGRVEVEDNGFQFDNTLYFTINKSIPIKIASIDGQDSDFLRRIFSDPGFSFSSMEVNQLEYNKLAAAQVIVLNEVEEFPESLKRMLEEKRNNHSHFIIIPPKTGISGSMEQLIGRFGFSSLGEPMEREKLVTDISFEHPLFADVFDERVTNFDYPATQLSYAMNSSAPAILRYEDKRPFLVESEGNFLFTAPLSAENSNFQRSPLIVPLFYKMGLTALQPPHLYYLLGEHNQMEIPVTLGTEEVLSLGSNKLKFIPQQRKFSDKIEIITDELPDIPGNFTFYNIQHPVLGVSYNVNRAENNQFNPQIPFSEDVIVLNSLKEFFSAPGFQKETDSLWKWFVIFALFFLLIETLLLKYIK